MNKTIIRSVLAIMAIGLCFFLTIFLYHQTKKRQMDYTVQQANVGDRKIFAIATNRQDKQAIERTWQSEMGKRVTVWANYLHEARAYEKAHNYELAEAKFKMAIEADKSDQGVARRGLARVYEASGQYKLALEQINWMIQRTSRKDVLDELTGRKQNLEKLLAAKAAQEEQRSSNSTTVGAVRG